MNTTRSAGFEPVYAASSLLSGLAVAWRSAPSRHGRSRLWIRLGDRT
jgi:hypothetical protein